MENNRRRTVIVVMVKGASIVLSDTGYQLLSGAVTCHALRPHQCNNVFLFSTTVLFAIQRSAHMTRCYSSFGNFIRYSGFRLLSPRMTMTSDRNRKSVFRNPVLPPRIHVSDQRKAASVHLITHILQVMCGSQ